MKGYATQRLDSSSTWAPSSGAVVYELLKIAQQNDREIVSAPSTNVSHMKTLALACGGRLTLIGDMNAAPEGGRWSDFQSKTGEADRLTVDWAHQCGLMDVPSIQRHAI